MAKVIRVTRCGECPHSLMRVGDTDRVYCDHHSVPPEQTNSEHTIPDWCPLVPAGGRVMTCLGLILFIIGLIEAFNGNYKLAMCLFVAVILLTITGRDDE